MHPTGAQGRFWWPGIPGPLGGSVSTPIPWNLHGNSLGSPPPMPRGFPQEIKPRPQFWMIKIPYENNIVLVFSPTF